MARIKGAITQAKIKKIKQVLMLEKEKLVMTNKSYEDFHLDKNELSDTLDEASVNIQASNMLRFRNREIFYLKEINQALQRIDDGAYGFCEECDDPISFERLMARPTADQCIGCKEEAELTEKGNVRKSSSMGKSFKELGFR